MGNSTFPLAPPSHCIFLEIAHEGPWSQPLSEEGSAIAPGGKLGRGAVAEGCTAA